MAWQNCCGLAGKGAPERVQNIGSSSSIETSPLECLGDAVVGPRSALAWLLDRYQVTIDKASGIVNDPNDWGAELGNPRYIIDLVKRVTTVSVETMAIVKSLPTLKEAIPSNSEE